MREVLRMAEREEPLARLALELYCYRIKKYIGAYFAVLGRLDAMVFTGGMGENLSMIRARACEGLVQLGIAIDPLKNHALRGDLTEIGKDGSPVKILVLRMNKEREIAQETVAAILQAR